MRRKIRVTFPKLVQEVLQIDQEYFNLKKETIYNLIIEGLGFQEISSIGADIIDEKRSINFNLNEKNSKLFSEMLRKSGLNELSETEFLKKIFITYANLHPSIRERILYKDIFLRIEEAIRKKKEINIYYKDKLEKIKPISFERNKENGNYTALRARISNKEYLIEMKEIEYVT